MNKQLIFTLVAFIVVVIAIVFLRKNVDESSPDQAQKVQSESIELVLWEQESDDNQKLIDDILADIAEKEHITVVRNHYPPEDLRVQYQTAALARGGADIVLAPNDLAGSFSVMGIIHNLTDKFDFNQYSDSVVDGVKDKNGNIWGLPFSQGNHLMLLVNKKIISEPILTIEQLIKEAKKFTDKKAKKFGFAYNLNEPFWFAPFVSIFNSKIYTPESGPQLNSQAMIETLNFVKDLKFKDKIVPDDCDYNCMDTLFMEGKTPIIINGDWSIQKYEQALGSDLGIYPLPKYEKTSLYMQPMVAGKYFFLNSKLEGAQLEAAIKVVSFLASDSSQLLFAQKSRLLPSLKEGEAVNLVKQDPVLSQVFEACSHSQSNPMDVEMRAVWDAIRPQLQGVMAGRVDPKEAGKTMQKDVVVKIKDIKN